MQFEIDVSGEDIFNPNYTIVVADKDNLIRGFKFSRKLIEVLRSRHGEGLYRYNHSKQGKTLIKIRIYCIVIYYLFKTIKFKDKKKEINLEVCRDFQGHENDINSNLKYFLEDKLGFHINIKYVKLPNDSNADKYAYLMRKDTKNKMKDYIKMSLEEIERYLRK